MTRYYKLSDKAKQALWTNTTGSPHIPHKWAVIGDSKDGYVVMTLDKMGCGFSVYDVATLKGAKGFIKEVNETGDSEMRAFCYVGSFAWKNHPIPYENH